MWGGPESKRYGGMKPGDYVFPVYKGEITKLWKLKNFSDGPNGVNSRLGAAHFEEIKIYNPPIRLTREFIVSRYFEVDIVLLNKASKQTQSVDFWPITQTADCPDPSLIDFSDTRNYYLEAVNPQRLSLIKPKEGDIRVVIDLEKNYKIDAIQEFKDGKYVVYDPLQNIYNQKNKPDERYTLKELLDYAIEDGARNKENYLKSVIKELEQKGSFKAPSPIGLYDNLLVGRRRTAHPDKSKDVEEESTEESELE